MRWVGSIGEICEVLIESVRDLPVVYARFGQAINWSDMPSFRAFEKELGKAFLKNLEASQAAMSSGKVAAGLLLLFYAVECGLKHILCVRRRGFSGGEDDALFWSHDLGEIAKELRLATVPLPLTFKLARGDENGASKDCHLAWRYGVGIAPSDEAKLQAGLDALATRIKQDIY